LLLNPFLISKVDEFDSLEIATVLRLELLFNQLLQSFSIVEEPIVLHDLELLTLGVFGDADIFALEDFRAQVAFVEVGLLASFAATSSG